MTPCPVEIDEKLVRGLVASQFPQWSHLPVRPVSRPGWDNRSFRLGEDWVARLPSASSCAAQAHREQRWLPLLRSHLPLSIPEPVALGRPGLGYPWHWSVYRWIPGHSAADEAPTSPTDFAADLALFLAALQAAPAANGPVPSAENFFRGGSLVVYDEQFRNAATALNGQIDSAVALRAWQAAAASEWRRAPVWVHGDIALGNLLLRQGRLAAVIDFGQVCVGDPACDLAIAWTTLRGEHREAFKHRLALDRDTWHRGRAWALWKAAIVAAKLVETNAAEGAACRQTLDEVLRDCASTEP